MTVLLITQSSAVLAYFSAWLIGNSTRCPIGQRTADFLPGLILLAIPTAMVAYVMAREMIGDDQFAVAAISTSTLTSALTYFVWMLVVGP